MHALDRRGRRARIERPGRADVTALPHKLAAVRALWRTRRERERASELCTIADVVIEVVLRRPAQLRRRGGAGPDCVRTSRELRYLVRALGG